MIPKYFTKTSLCSNLSTMRSLKRAQTRNKPTQGRGQSRNYMMSNRTRTWKSSSKRVRAKTTSRASQIIRGNTLEGKAKLNCSKRWSNNLISKICLLCRVTGKKQASVLSHLSCLTSLKKILTKLWSGPTLNSSETLKSTKLNLSRTSLT